jgi:hypothetical protein
MYIEHAQKILGFNRSFVLANCFLNINTFRSSYSKELIYEINKYCPSILQKKLQVPDFYLNLIKSKVK